MKVLNDLLAYEHLKIYQRTDMFAFSLDSVLLARFVPHIKNHVKNILDVGTNNAVIPLILSSYTTAKIMGVEILPEAISLAQENLILNQKTDQISLQLVDYNDFAKQPQIQKFEMVYCNPPFFAIGEAKLNNNDNKLYVPARHEVHLSFEQLVFATSSIIANYGSFLLVHRVNRLAEIIATLTKYNFVIKRLQFIHPFAAKMANSVLIEARFQSNPGGLIVEPPIIVHNVSGEYSDQVKKYFKK